MNKELYGVAFTASYYKGWREAGRMLTRSKYDTAKALLGLRGGASVGGFYLAFRELRMGWRLDVAMVLRVVMLRARVSLLPDNHPVARIVANVQEAGVATWGDHAREMMVEWGITEEAGVGVAPEQWASPETRRKWAARYRRTIVGPRIASRERSWATAELENLARAAWQLAWPVPYRSLVGSAAVPRGWPMHVPGPPGVPPTGGGSGGGPPSGWGARTWPPPWDPSGSRCAAGSTARYASCAANSLGRGRRWERQKCSTPSCGTA